MSASTNIQHQGYVKKLGDKNLFGQRQWLQRYLVLFDDRIVYFKKQEDIDGAPKDKAVLTFAGRDVLIEEQPADAQKTGTFAHGGVSSWRFAITSEAKGDAQAQRFLFAIGTEEAYKAWVSKIKAQIEAKGGKHFDVKLTKGHAKRNSVKAETLEQLTHLQAQEAQIEVAAETSVQP